MGYFFTNSFDETDLKRALSAYQKAVSLFLNEISDSFRKQVKIK
jgi:hypothetical protein